MKMLMQVKFPNDPFNEKVRDGNVGQIITRILDEIKPSAAYFTEFNGQRGAILLVEVANPSQVPILAEPFFLEFDAEVEFHVVMSPEELGQSHLEQQGKKWAA